MEEGYEGNQVRDPNTLGSDEIVHQDTQESAAPKGQPPSMACTNCYQPFDLESYTPYVLPCQHTELACKQCLRGAHKSKHPFMCHQDNRVVSLLLLKTLAKNIDVIRVLRSRELAEAEKVKAREETEFSNYSQKKLEERAEGVYIDVRNSGPRGSRVEPMDPKRLSMMQDAAPSRKSLGEPGADIKSLPTFMRSSHSPNKEEDGNNLQKSNPSQEDTVKISTPALPRMYQPPKMASRQPSSMLNSQQMPRNSLPSNQEVSIPKEIEIPDQPQPLVEPERVPSIKDLAVEEVSMSVSPSGGKKKKKKTKKKKVGNISVMPDEGEESQNASVASNSHRDVRTEPAQKLETVFENPNQRSQSFDAKDLKQGPEEAKQPTNQTPSKNAVVSLMLEDMVGGYGGDALDADLMAAQSFGEPKQQLPPPQTQARADDITFAQQTHPHSPEVQPVVATQMILIEKPPVSPITQVPAKPPPSPIVTVDHQSTAGLQLIPTTSPVNLHLPETPKAPLTFSSPQKPTAHISPQNRYQAALPQDQFEMEEEVKEPAIQYQPPHAIQLPAVNQLNQQEIQKQLDLLYERQQQELRELQRQQMAEIQQQLLKTYQPQMQNQGIVGERRGSQMAIERPPIHQRALSERVGNEDDFQMTSMIRRYEESNPPSRAGSAAKQEAPTLLGDSTANIQAQFSQTLPPQQPASRNLLSQGLASPTNNIPQLDSSSKSVSHTLNQRIAPHYPSLHSQLPLRPLPQPLPEFCPNHPREKVKYLCRSQDCMIGLCPECILQHSKHDLSAANEIAAYEIKQIVRQAQRQCKKQAKHLKGVRTLTDDKLGYLRSKRDEQFEKLRILFDTLRETLARREMQLQAAFNAEIQEVEQRLAGDGGRILALYQEYVDIFQELRNLGERYTVSSDLGIVSSANKAQTMHQRTIEMIEDIQQREKQFYVVEIQMRQKQILEEMDFNNDPNRDLKLPSFNLDTELERLRLDQIGSVVPYNSDDVGPEPDARQPLFNMNPAAQYQPPLPPFYQPYQNQPAPMYPVQAPEEIMYQQQLQKIYEQLSLLTQNPQQPSPPPQQDVKIQQTEDDKHITIKIIKNGEETQMLPPKMAGQQADQFIQGPTQPSFSPDYYQSQQQAAYALQQQQIIDRQLHQIQEMQHQIEQFHYMQQLQLQQMQQAPRSNQKQQFAPIPEEQDEMTPQAKQTRAAGVQVDYLPQNKPAQSVKNKKVQTRKRRAADIFTQFEASNEGRGITTQTEAEPKPVPREMAVQSFQVPEIVVVIEPLVGVELQTQTSAEQQQLMTYELYTQTSLSGSRYRQQSIGIQPDELVLPPIFEINEPVTQSIEVPKEAPVIQQEKSDCEVQTDPLEAPKKSKTMRSAAIQTARRKMNQVTVPLLDMVVPRPIVVMEVVATQTQEAPRKSLSALQLQTYPGDSIPAREGRRKKTLRNVSIQAWPPLPDTNEGIQVDPLKVSSRNVSIQVDPPMQVAVLPPTPSLDRQSTLSGLELFKATAPYQLKNLHWFRWDSNEVYRLDADSKQWLLREDLRISQKFLFFSCVLHLPSEQGCFIMGGSDNEDNYSKRVQYFCKYNVFIEKPQMITRRAFFCAVFTKLDNAIYVFGGSDSNHTDLSECEKLSLVENVWRPIQKLKTPRNGASAVYFEQYRLIFVVGGNSHAKGSLSSIEKYEIDFDKWTQIDVTLKKPIHDMSILQISRDRILIFGGHTDGGGPNKDIQQVDLSMECFKAKYGYSSLALPEASTGGKTYFPPHFDPATGRVQLIFGYCDQPPSIEEIDIRDFTIYSAPPASTVANSLQQSVDDEKWKLNSLSLPPGDVSESSGAEERKKRKKSPFQPRRVPNVPQIVITDKSQVRSKSQMAADAIEKNIGRKQRHTSMSSKPPLGYQSNERL